MTSTFLLFAGGLVVLIIGADLLVRGASRMAAAFGISPLVIGLTIVALGTASPEIAVSLQAAVNGQGDLTLGNVLGSNIFNILFILGVTAILTPVVIAEQLIRKDAPIMLGVSLLAFFLSVDGRLGSWDGLTLLAGMVFYIVFALRQSQAETREVQDEYAREYSEKQPRSLKNTAANFVMIITGLGLLVLGARWLVDSAVMIAKALGVSELVIGLTIVAAGTSLPEVATSVIAALKKENDIAVGNAVGSNIFNLLGVLGLGAVFAPGGISVAAHVLRLDFPVMVFVALVSLPVFYIDSRISRAEGGLLLGYYFLYVTYLVLLASKHPALPTAAVLIVAFTVISFILLFAGAIRSARARQKR